MDFKNMIYTFVMMIVLLPILYKMTETAIYNETKEYVTETVKKNKLYYLAFIPTIAYVLYACSKNGANMYSVVCLIIGIAMGWSCITDLKHQELADTSTLIFFIFAFGIWLNYDLTTQLQQINTIIVVIGALVLVWKFLECIGFGDIKLMVPILLFLTPSQYLGFLSNSLMLGLLYAIGLILFQKVSEERRFAFGPCLIYGFYLILFGFDTVTVLSNLLLK